MLIVEATRVVCMPAFKRAVGVFFTIGVYLCLAPTCLASDALNEQLANAVDRYSTSFPSLSDIEKQEKISHIRILLESGADPDAYVRNTKITSLALSVAPIIDLDLIKELISYSHDINKSHWGNETLLGHL